MKERCFPCPIAKVAELLSDHWTLLILRDTLDSPKRFRELEQSLQGISTRTLTSKLKRLVERGVLEKTDDGHYTITLKGKDLRSILSEMAEYGKKHFSE